MRVRVNGAWAEVPSGRVYVNGAWRQIKEARAYISGAWETIATFVPDLSVAISPSFVSRSITDGGIATTSTVTATPSGGQLPYTYAWTRIDGTRSTTSAPTSASTTFSCSLAPEDEVSDTWRVTVTDSFGTTATADILVTFSSISSF